MKKSMLTLFALSALTSSNMYSLDTQSVATTLIQQNLTNDTNQKPSTSTRTSDSSNQATNDSKKSKDSSEKPCFAIFYSLIWESMLSFFNSQLAFWNG